MSEALLAKRAELERELVRRREACSSWAERRLLSQLQSHTSKMKRLQKRQLQEDGWEKRRLGVIEYFMWKMDGIVMWCVMELSSNVDLEQVSHRLASVSVEATVKRHATLRCRVEGTGRQKRLVAPPFEVFMKENPELVVDAGNVDPYELVERELAKGELAKPKGMNRLWRMWLTMEHGSKGALVVLVHHTIMDGFSLAVWLNEIGYYANTIIAAGSTPEAEQAVLASVRRLPLPVPFEKQISWWPERKLRTLSVQWAFQRYVMGLMAPTLPKSARPSKERRTRILTHWMTIEETDALVRRVKAEDTTVAGAVGAASLLVIHDMIDHDKAGGRRPHHNLHLQVMLCLRLNAIKRGNFDAMEEMGHMSVPINQIVSPYKLGGFWATARAIRRRISKAVRTGEYFEAIKEFKFCMATSSTTFPAIRKVYEKAEGRYCALNLISMGNIDEVMAQPEGELHSPRIAAGVDVSTSGPYLTVSCMTVQGALGLSLSIAEPCVTTEQAKTMMKRITDELTRVGLPEGVATAFSSANNSLSLTDDEAKPATERGAEEVKSGPGY